MISFRNKAPKKCPESNGLKKVAGIKYNVM